MSTVWLLIATGQSNGEGRGTFREAQDTDVTDIYQFVNYSLDPNYGQIISDITPLISVEPFAGAGGYGSDRVGPHEYSARQILADSPAGDKVVIVPIAVGGTTVYAGARRWYPNLTGTETEGNLYRAAINRANAAYTACQSMFPGYTIEPIIFINNGEFDATGVGGGPSTTYQQYYDTMALQIAGYRANITGATNAKVIIGSMIPYYWELGSAGYNSAYAAINEAQVDLSLNLVDVYYSRGPGTGSNMTQDFLHYSPTDQVRLQGTYLGLTLSDTTGPTMTSADIKSSTVGDLLAHSLTSNDIHSTFHINGGADASRFEISDSYITPKLRWIGNGTGPVISKDYVVKVRARDGTGNFGPDQTITVTVSNEVNPATFYSSGERGITWAFDNSADIATNFDGTGGTPAIDTVLGWVKDLSPNANHWHSASNNTTRPLIKLDIDGFKYILFDGTNDLLIANTPFIAANNGKFTAILGLLAASTPTGARSAISSVSHTTNTPFIDPIQKVSGSANITTNMRNDSSSGAGSQPVLSGMMDGLTKRVITSQYNGSNSFIRLRDAMNRPSDGLDGNWTSTTQGTFANNFNVTRASLGGRAMGSPQAFWNGSIYAGIVINRILSPTELKAGEEWVANRTLTTLLPGQNPGAPSTHPTSYAFIM